MSRQEQKERTRAAILAAALELLEDEAFGSLSLRSLTRRVGIVPTAFYRHFASIDELGLALVEESFATLRELIRAVRAENPPVDEIIERSVAVLVEHAAEHAAHFRFIGRELYGGVAVVRNAIEHELSLFERELAVDLARMPPLRAWPAADLALLSDLIVQLMVTTSGRLAAPDAQRPGRRLQIAATATSQLRMIVVGVVGWTPGGAD